IRDHIVAEDDCPLNGLNSRVVPSRAIELTAVFLDRNVTPLLPHRPNEKVSPQQKHELAERTHLRGAGPAKAFARRGSQATARRRGDFVRDESWIVRLSAEEIAEIDAALRSAQRHGISIETVTRNGFSLPTLAKLLAEARRELEYGRGFVLLRGIPVERYS